MALLTLACDMRRQLHFDLNVARNQNAKLKEELRLREEECKRLLKDAQELSLIHI